MGKIHSSSRCFVSELFALGAFPRVCRTRTGEACSHRIQSPTAARRSRSAHIPDPGVTLSAAPITNSTDPASMENSGVSLCASDTHRWELTRQFSQATQTTRPRERLRRPTTAGEVPPEAQFRYRNKRRPRYVGPQGLSPIQGRCD